MPFWMQSEDPQYYPENPTEDEFTEDDYDELNVPLEDNVTYFGA